MRRLHVSDEDTDTIIRLRKSGASWLKIEAITGIPRRTAKREFEQWQRSQSDEELKSARQQVAAEVFNSHMKDLLALVQSVLSELGEPELRDRRDGAVVLGHIFERDIRRRGQERILLSTVKHDTNQVRRQNKMLFSSLKEHTRDSVDWGSFDAWLVARDTWKAGMDRLYSEAARLVDDIIDQEFDVSDKAGMGKAQEAQVNLMANGVVEVVYRAIVENKVNEVDRIESYINTAQVQNGAIVLVGGGISTTDLSLANEQLADRAASICKRVANSLFRKESKTIQGMSDSLLTILGSRDYLAERLDELRLIPLILRTRCELCPA